MEHPQQPPTTHLPRGAAAPEEAGVSGRPSLSFVSVVKTASESGVKLRRCCPFSGDESGSARPQPVLLGTRGPLSPPRGPRRVGRAGPPEPRAAARCPPAVWAPRACFPGHPHVRGQCTGFVRGARSGFAQVVHVSGRGPRRSDGVCISLCVFRNYVDTGKHECSPCKEASVERDLVFGKCVGSACWCRARSSAHGPHTRTATP